MQLSGESFSTITPPTHPTDADPSDPTVMWDYVDPGASLDEQLIGNAAAYIALNRYIHGQDLYIIPTTLDELDQAL